MTLPAQDGDAMSHSYIEQRDDVYMVAGTRVSLDSIVYAFLSGQSAEAISQAFPALSLEQVYGAIPRGFRAYSAVKTLRAAESVLAVRGQTVDKKWTETRKGSVFHRVLRCGAEAGNLPALVRLMLARAAPSGLLSHLPHFHALFVLSCVVACWGVG